MNGKLAGRREVAPGLALRGGVSTGFRAPTPGQQNAFNVSTQWDPNLMELVNNGTIPSTSRVAALRGGKALDAEKSLNLAAGMVLERGSFLLTADVFRIDLRDRLGVTQLFALEADEVDQLLAEGITSAANLANFRFFANDFETRTEGVDLVASWQPPAWGGHTTLDFAVNLTRTDVVEHNPATLDTRRIRELRDALPGLRWNASVHHEIGRVELLGRLGYFDGWWDPRDAWAYGGAYLVDLEAALRIDERTRFVIGGRNALDGAADRNPNPTVIGNVYSTRAPFDTNGGFYYARFAVPVGSGRRLAISAVNAQRSLLRLGRSAGLGSVALGHRLADAARFVLRAAFEPGVLGPGEDRVDQCPHRPGLTLAPGGVRRARSSRGLAE